MRVAAGEVDSGDLQVASVDEAAVECYAAVGAYLFCSCGAPGCRRGNVGGIIPLGRTQSIPDAATAPCRSAGSGEHIGDALC